MRNFIKRFVDASSVKSIAVFLISGFFAWFPLTNTDIWWHLATAREMLASATYLYTDPFSFTPHVECWINLHWVFQLVAYGIYQVASVKGLVLCKAALFGLTTVVVYYAIPAAKRGWIGVLLLGLAVFEVRYLVLARPIVVTTLMIALFMSLFERWRVERRVGYLLPLIPLQIIWTNAQGLFILGPVIAGAYWMGDGLIAYLVASPARSGKRIDRTAIRDISAIAGAIVLSTIVNPRHVHGILFPFKLFSRIDPNLKNIYATNVSENAPLMTLMSNEPRYFVSAVIITLLLVVSFFAALRRFRWSHAMLSIGFFALAFMAKRNILLYFIVAVPILVHNFGLVNHPEARLKDVAYYRKNIIGMMGVIILLFGFTHAKMLSISPGNGIAPFRYPQEAVRYLDGHPVGGNMFNAIRAGGYLLWERYPPHQVFIDGRLIIRTPAFFAEYLSILDNPDLFAALDRRFSITHVLVPTALHGRYKGFAARLYRLAEWKLVSYDGAWALFYHEDVASGTGINLANQTDVDRITTQLKRKWRQNPEIYQEAIGYIRQFLLQLSLNTDPLATNQEKRFSGNCPLISWVHPSKF
ncbi:MAG: hypothetical protein GF398_06310 [Chitinivibrionales bacterium]|nr:hypothetical protein [Chitinivibrionales bacterium]